MATYRIRTCGSECCVPLQGTATISVHVSCPRPAWLFFLLEAYLRGRLDICLACLTYVACIACIMWGRFAAWLMFSHRSMEVSAKRDQNCWLRLLCFYSTYPWRLGNFFGGWDVCRVDLERVALVKWWNWSIYQHAVRRIIFTYFNYISVNSIIIL